MRGGEGKGKMGVFLQLLKKLHQCLCLYLISAHQMSSSISYPEPNFVEIILAAVLTAKREKHIFVQFIHCLTPLLLLDPWRVVWW